MNEELLKRMLMERWGRNLSLEDDDDSSNSDNVTSDDSTLSECSDSSQDDGQLSEFEVTKQFLYPKTIESIRKDLRGHKIYVSMTFCQYDHTYRSSDDWLVNLIVGPMGANSNNKECCFLLKSQSMDRFKSYNKQFLVKVFNDAMNLLWPNHLDAHLEDILLLITEESDIVIDETVKDLCAQFPRMIHLPSLARLLCDVKDNIRFSYSKADELHIAMRPFLWFPDPEGKYFYQQTKIPVRQYRFMDFCVLMANEKANAEIRNFFNQNFKAKGFKKDYHEIKDLLKDPEAKKQTLLIKSQYHLLQIVRRLICKFPKIELVRIMDTLERLVTKMNEMVKSPNASEVDLDIYEQLEGVLKVFGPSNEGYTKLYLISKFLAGKEEWAQSFEEFPTFLSRADLERFRYAPLGAINRKWVFSPVNEILYSDRVLNSWPVEYFDYLSVTKAYGQSSDYESSMNFLVAMEKMDADLKKNSNIEEIKDKEDSDDEDSDEDEEDESDSDDVSSDDSSGPSSDSDDY